MGTGTDSLDLPQSKLGGFGGACPSCFLHRSAGHGLKPTRAGTRENLGQISLLYHHQVSDTDCMLSTSNPANEVTMHLSISDCRLIVACIYMAQCVESLGLSNAQNSRAGQITSALHGGIVRSLRQSRD